MSETLRAALRGLTIAAGVIVTLLSVFAFRLADWPIWLAPACPRVAPCCAPASACP